MAKAKRESYKKAANLLNTDSFTVNQDNSSNTSSFDPVIGSIVAGRFDIIELIGIGGWSRVYKARQINLNRTVALKILHAHLTCDREKVARFQREAESLSNLLHPNICTIFDCGVLLSGQPYIVMEFLKGESLASKLRHEGQLSPDEALPIFISCCEGLLAAHKKGIIHRDIKPANIFVISETSKPLTKLLDFGLAKILKSETEKPNLSQTSDTLGTVQYMSPEQVLGHRVDLRSDIYSLGCVMYEALTGHKLFDGKTSYQVMSQHVNEAPQGFGKININLSLLSTVETVVLKALAKDPQERYQNVEELKHSLEKLSNPSLTHSSNKLGFSKKLASILSLLLLIAGIVFTTAWFIFKMKQSWRISAPASIQHGSSQPQHGKQGFDYSETVDKSGKKIKRTIHYGNNSIIADEYIAEYDPKNQLAQEIYNKYNKEGQLQASSQKDYLANGTKECVEEYSTSGNIAKVYISRYNLRNTLVEFIHRVYDKNNSSFTELDRVLDKTGKHAVKDTIKAYGTNGTLLSIKELAYDPTGKQVIKSSDIKYDNTTK